MAFSHVVPEGKVLYVKTGDYHFVGPCTAALSGGHTLPPTYVDGTPTAVQPIGRPKKVVVDKMALPADEVERDAPPQSKLSQFKAPGRKKK